VYASINVGFAAACSLGEAFRAFSSLAITAVNLESSAAPSDKHGKVATANVVASIILRSMTYLTFLLLLLNDKTDHSAQGQ
jgi:hypothetical protein